MNENRTAIEGVPELVRTEEPWESEAKALDPKFGGEVHGRPGCESAVCSAGHHTVVVRVGDWTSGLFDLASEEVVEGIVSESVEYSSAHVSHMCHILESTHLLGSGCT